MVVESVVLVVLPVLVQEMEVMHVGEGSKLGEVVGVYVVAVGSWDVAAEVRRMFCGSRELSSGSKNSGH